MVFSLSRLIIAVVIAVIVGIVLVGLLGPVLVTVKVPIAETIGRFFEDWGFVLGVLAGLWYYFTNGSWRVG